MRDLNAFINPYALENFINLLTACVWLYRRNTRCFYAFYVSCFCIFPSALMFLPAAETAAPGYTLMLLFSENSGLRICSVRIPDLYNNNIQIGNLNFV